MRDLSSPLSARRAARGRGPHGHRADRPDRHRAVQACLPERRRAALRAAPLQPDVQTDMGPVQDEASIVHSAGDGPGLVRQLQERPAELAQEIPFGIAQIGKSFRTRSVRELRLPDARVRADGDAVLRPAGRSRADLRGVASAPLGLVCRYGVTPERLRFREHAPDELAHYAKKAIDVEYRFPFGWK